MGDVPVHHGPSPDDWTTGILECCGGDGYGKAGDSAGSTICKFVTTLEFCMCLRFVMNAVQVARSDCIRTTGCRASSAAAATHSCSTTSSELMAVRMVALRLRNQQIKKTNIR